MLLLLSPKDRIHPAETGTQEESFHNQDDFKLIVHNKLMNWALIFLDNVLQCSWSRRLTTNKTGGTSNGILYF